MPYIIIREVATEALSIAHVSDGYTCLADPKYRWAGFWATAKAARAALRAKGSADLWYDDARPTIHSQLYGPARACNGTPGPESMKELFRIG